MEQEPCYEKIELGIWGHVHKKISGDGAVSFLRWLRRFD